MIGRNVRYIASVVMLLALATVPINVGFSADVYAASHDAKHAGMADVDKLHGHAQNSENDTDCSETQCCGACTETLASGINTHCASGSCVNACQSGPSWFGVRNGILTVIKAHLRPPPLFALGRPILGPAPPHGPPKI